MARRARARSASSCGCTCSNRTRPTAIRRRPRGPRSSGTTTRSRRRTAQVGPPARRARAICAPRTLIVPPADHGEAFGEHGEISHSLFVYDTTLRVPLIVAGPRVPRGRDGRRPVSLVDVAPTIASMAGTGRRSTEMAGRSTSDLRDLSTSRGPVRRVVRAAARFRLESAAGYQERRLEVHRGADSPSCTT